MSRFRLTILTLSLCLGLSQAGSAPAASAESSQVKYPALVSAGQYKVPSGRNTLPFIISLAEHPELLQPPYLRMVLGTPDRARAYAYPTNTFTWTPADGSSTHFILSRNLDARPPAGGETRQLVTTFKRSEISLKAVRSKLGKPIRRYFDNQTEPVELFQISPNTTLAITEPTNSFEVSQMTVNYSGPYLPQVSATEMSDAAFFRLKQIDHHLSKGNRDRGLSLLQEHVGDNPQDIGARIVLAQALRSRSDVNGSIAEYRKALALAQASGDVEMQKKAMQGLAPIGLVPAGAPVVRALSLQEAARGGSTPF